MFAKEIALQKQNKGGLLDNFSEDYLPSDEYNTYYLLILL